MSVDQNMSNVSREKCDIFMLLLHDCKNKTVDLD